MPARRAAALLAIALLTGCGGGDDEREADRTVSNPVVQEQPPELHTSEASVVVNLDETSVDGQKGAGSATIAAVGERRTRVVVQVGETDVEPGPAHVHRGPCGQPGAEVVESLQDVEQGRSSSVLDVPLKELVGRPPVSIDVHPRAGEGQLVCGEVEQSE